MQRLLFVDHSYHARTLATQFLQDLLAARFAVDVLWDESWAGGDKVSAEALDAGSHDAIVFFQILPRVRTLKRLRCQNLTWVPMRDGLWYGSRELQRLGGGPVKVLNFCREAHDFFLSHGHRSLGVQYWPEPAPASPPRGRETPRLFFWPRRREIGWPTLKALLGDFRPEGIVLRYATDPGHELPEPDEADIREYRIEIVRGWLEHAEYHRLLTGCDVFVAPRPLEGIGQSVLEAMRHGMAVIAPDAPTMNEYVSHGRSGWLYPLSAPRPLDFRDWAARGAAARADVAQGRVRWLAEQAGIADFVATPARADLRWRLRRLARW